MLVKCINKKCPHKWDYKGKSKSYICCPKCSYRFKIQRGIDEYSKSMLTYSRNIPSKKDNIVNIVKEEPKRKEYVKVIKKPQTEFIEKKEVKECKGINEFNFATLGSDAPIKIRVIKKPKVKIIPWKKHQGSFA